MTLLTLSDGTPVTPFAFGTMQFGGTADAAASQALSDPCRAARITHFDSAYAYTDGRSETLPVDCARTERDKVYVATKVSHAMDDALYARLSALTPTPPPATDRLEEA